MTTTKTTRVLSFLRESIFNQNSQLFDKQHKCNNIQTHLLTQTFTFNTLTETEKNMLCECVKENHVLYFVLNCSQTITTQANNNGNIYVVARNC